MDDSPRRFPSGPQPSRGPHAGEAPAALRPPASAGLTIYFALTPHFLLLDYAGPAEVFRLAAAHGAPLRLHSCAAAPSLACSIGLEMSGLEALPAALPADALVMVGGMADPAANLGHPHTRAVVRWLAEQAGRETAVASVCAGALLLGEAGLLARRRCTTHHALQAQLRAAAPDATVEEGRIFVEDGPVTTSAGITTGIDLALHLVERHFGAALASRVARDMVIWVRRSGHDPQLSPWLAWRNHLHPAVHRAQDEIARDPARPWPLAELAAAVHVSPRHLSRLFERHAGLGVAAYQQQLRLALARRLLEDSTLPLERVAEQAGFASARSFRRAWAQQEHEPPGASRRRSRGAAAD